MREHVVRKDVVREDVVREDVMRKEREPPLELTTSGTNHLRN